MIDSLRRTLWISRVTFLEAVRQRFFAFLLVLCVAMVLSSVSLRVFDFGHGELKFIADFGFGGDVLLRLCSCGGDDCPAVLQRDRQQDRADALG